MLPLDFELCSWLHDLVPPFGSHLVLTPKVTLGIDSCMSDFYWLWSPSMMPPAMLSMPCYPTAHSCYQDNIPILFQLAKSLFYKGITQWPSKSSPNILGEARNHCLPRVVLIKIYNPSINMELYSPVVMESRCLPEPCYSMDSFHPGVLFIQKDCCWLLGIYPIKTWISNIVWDRPILFLSCPNFTFHFSCLSFALLVMMLLFFLPS